MEETKVTEENLDTQIKELMNSTPKEARKKKKKLSKKAKIIIGVISALLILFILLNLIFSHKGGKTVDISKLEKSDIEEVLSITGPIGGSESVDITSSIHAKITELNVKEGDKVIAGETILAKIDPEELERSVEIARGNYELQKLQADDKTGENKRMREKSAQDLKMAQDNYNRQAELKQIGAVSDLELETALAALNDAKRQYNTFHNKNLDKITSLQLNNAKLELEQLEDRLSNAILTAPISGTVTRVNTKIGQFADYTENRAPLMTIENLSDLEMKLLVSEYNIGKVKLNQSVKIYADILGKNNYVNGEVMSISPTGEIKAGAGSERVIPVKVKITDKDTSLISGISGKAKIILDAATDVYSVPISAVSENADGKSVIQFIVDKKENTGIVKVIEVETGIESDVSIEIKSQLKEILGTEDIYYLTSFEPDLSDGFSVSFKQ